MNFKEVSKEKFEEVIGKIPHNRSVSIDDGTVWYEAKKGLFRNSGFAYKSDGKYFVYYSFIKEPQ